MSENIFNRIKNLFGVSSLDDDFYDELEESLILADIGIQTTEELIDYLKSSVKDQKIKTPGECRQYLIDFLKAKMQTGSSAYEFENKKSVLLIVGVNGVGKTTTIAKLANFYKSKGKKVILAGADTFRAGATEQIKSWADKIGVRVIAGADGADPGAVVFDAVNAAKASDADLLICDTAGRLHNKKDLMEELLKIYKIIEKNYGEANVYSIMILDSLAGQNALNQAREFSDIAKLSGIILTKTDSSAKGGIAIAIESEMNLPVLFACFGEKINDIKKFNSDEYVEELF